MVWDTFALKNVCQSYELYASVIGAQTNTDPADRLTELLLISIYGSVISPWAPG